MQRGSLLDCASRAAVIDTVYRTSNAGERLGGLLVRPPLGANEGLLIVPCASIHTLFMRYPIDVVYLDREYVITRIVPALAPWRFSFKSGATMTLELASGGAARAGLTVARRLLWQSGTAPT